MKGYHAKQASLGPWRFTHATPRFRDRLDTIFSGYQNFSSWFDLHVEIIKQDTYSEVGFAETLALGRVYVKRYRAKTWLHRVGIFHGRSRAARCFDNNTALLENAIPVPNPYCVVIEKDSLGFPLQSYYLCQGLVSAPDFKSVFLNRAEYSYGDGSEKFGNIGKQLALLHNAGYMHGDFKWSNVLLLGVQVFFVDLDNVKTVPESSMAGARDVARFILNAEDLAIDKTEINYFLEAYRTNRTASLDNFSDAVATNLKKLRRRHRVRYGGRAKSIF